MESPTSVYQAGRERSGVGRSLQPWYQTGREESSVGSPKSRFRGLDFGRGPQILFTSLAEKSWVSPNSIYQAGKEKLFVGRGP